MAHKGVSPKLQPKPIPRVISYDKIGKGPQKMEVTWKLRPLGLFNKDRSSFQIQRNTSHKGAPSFRDCRCTGCWDVVHTDAEELRFLETSERIGNTKTMYHGTPNRNIVSIAERGLRVGGSWCMFGPGIYVGPPEKAVGYTDNHGRWCSWASGKESHAFYLLEVQVALGRVKVCPSAQSFTLAKIQAEGFDSVHGQQGYTQGTYGTLRNSEYVLYSPDQVYVTKIFEYQYTHVQDPLYLKPSAPVVGTCAVQREKNIPLSPGTQAFKDLLTQKECGNKAPTHVYEKELGAGDVWVCNECIARLKLRKGSVFKIRTMNGKTRDFRIDRWG